VADLSGANLFEAFLSGASAHFAIVDGKTFIYTSKSRFDKNTDFSNVGLDSARIEGRLKAQLKRNIREIHWNERYEQNPLLNIVRPFWWASDYGSSTWRLIFSFFVISLLFTLLYVISTIPAPDWITKTFRAELEWGDWTLSVPLWITYDYPFVEGLVEYEALSNRDRILKRFDVARCLRAFYFSVATMTTLGIGNIKAHTGSLMGLGLVTLQVLIGHVILGALITRLAILFQEVE
jgi:hypothetical protein